MTAIPGSVILDPATSDETTAVRPPRRGEAARPEPRPRGKMPTLLGLGAGDPRVSAARAAIMAHEAARSQPAAKELQRLADDDLLDDDSIFADDAVETTVRGESAGPSSKRTGPTAPARGKSPPGPSSGPGDKPRVTLPMPSGYGYGSKPAGKTASTGAKPPPPRPSANAAPHRPPPATSKPSLLSPMRGPAPPTPSDSGFGGPGSPPNPPGEATHTHPGDSGGLDGTRESPARRFAGTPSLPENTLQANPVAAVNRVELTEKLPLEKLVEEERSLVAAPAPSVGQSQPSDPLAAASAVAPEARENLVSAPEMSSFRPRRLDEPVLVPLSSLAGAGAALVVMVVGAFLAGRATAAGGLGRSEALTAYVGVGQAAMAARNAVAPPPKPCWVARQPVRWASQVEKSVPFDVVATADEAFAVGFARDAREAAGVSVDPVTGALTERFAETTSTDVERVTALPAGGKAFAVIASSPDAVLSGAVQLPDERGGLVGVHAGALSALARPDAAPEALFPLGEAASVEALRVQNADAAGFALVMRRSSGIWGGWISAARKPTGELVQLVGSGGSVGKPMTGWNGRELAVVFADRPSEDASWQIRIGRAKPPALPSSTVVVALPKGGPGGDAFAPGIAGLADGRWLLVWTEGEPGGRAIRAQTLAPDFTVVGDPIALSPPAGNFGQGIVASSGAYATAVFLSKSRSSYELWGAILQCE